MFRLLTAIAAYLCLCVSVNADTITYCYEKEDTFNLMRQVIRYGQKSPKVVLFSFELEEAKKCYQAELAPSPEAEVVEKYTVVGQPLTFYIIRDIAVPGGKEVYFSAGFSDPSK